MSAINCTKLVVASKAAAWPALFDSMRSRGGDGSGERSDEAEHAVGTPCAVAAHDWNLDGRKIFRRWMAADRVAEVRQGRPAFSWRHPANSVVPSASTITVGVRGAQ